MNRLDALRNVRLLAAAGLLAFAGCALVPFRGYQLSVPYGELSERIGQRFPMERNIADLLTVTLTRPRMAPILPPPENRPGNNSARLAFTVDLQVRLPSLLNTTQRTLWGSMTLSGVPRYEPTSKGIVLADAKIDRVRVDNMPDALSGALAKTASQLAKEYLDNKPIYAFTATQVERLGLHADKASLSFMVLADRLVVARQ